MIQVDQHLFRSARPKDLSQLAPYKIGTIISLQSGTYELLHNDRLEQQFPADFAIWHYPLRSCPVFPPSERTVRKAMSIIAFAIVKDRRILVHCLSGVDRTGFIVAVYRMQYLDWSFEKAYAEWVERGRHWHLDWWKYELKKYAPT